MALTAECWPAGAFAVKGAAKIVERFLASGLFTNKAICIQPNEFAFIVEVDSATPHAPVLPDP